MKPPFRARAAQRLSPPVVALAAIVALSARPAMASVPVRGTNPPFTAAVPDGFAPMPGTREGAFAFARRRDRSAPLVVTLRPLRGVVSRRASSVDEMRAAVRQVSPSAEVSLRAAPAMGFEVPLVLARVPGSSTAAVASLPVVPNAVELTVSGGPDDGLEVERVARAVMASFRARSNWLTAAEFARRRAARWLIYVAGAALVAYALAWLTRFRARPSPGAQAAWLGASGAALVTAAALLASLPAGASPFDPFTPLVAGVVVLGNAVAIAWRASRARVRVGTSA